MTSKPVEVRVPITELHYVGSAKIKTTAIEDRPEPMSSPINNPAYCFLHSSSGCHSYLVWGFNLHLPSFNSMLRNINLNATSKTFWLHYKSLEGQWRCQLKAVSWWNILTLAFNERRSLSNIPRNRKKDKSSALSRSKHHYFPKGPFIYYVSTFLGFLDPSM